MFALLFTGLLPTATFATDTLELEQIDISSTALEKRANGTVQGYRATRSDTSIEKVPQSISMVPRQVIEDLGDPRIDRALDFAGGVGRQNDFGGMVNARFSVRGLTSGFRSVPVSNASRAAVQNFARPSAAYSQCVHSFHCKILVNTSQADCINRQAKNINN
ncbi:hypothetical protein AXE65_03985 [Ventosimonas gracilis]|uniref:TonB-dependent receptor plug domain-containing protein n=1 Tax=Ventosimonas gracilis TaxID=1680762 RepID=A0A139SRD5_9GAMM|nr:hypothetical protein AXE65_03985 [Ventosimonas gracilis]